MSFKAVAGIILLLAITLGSLTGFGYLVTVAIVEGESQPVAIAALLTVLGLLLTSVGWAQVLMLAQRLDRDESSSK